MSQFPNQYPNPQGFGPQGYGPQGYGPQGYPPPNNPNRNTGSKTALIIVIVVGVLFAGILFCGILAGLLLPALQAARNAARQMTDSNNLKQVGLAFHNYEATYKRLPAPITVNAAGVKVWSWTVALTPFCEDTQIYSQVNFLDMQPWNAPQNSFMQGPSPAWLTSSRSVNINECHVFVLSAPTKQPRGNPIFIEGTYTKFDEITDGLGNTILTIMLVNHSVPWASPTTLTIDEAYQLVQREPGKVVVGMADGSVTMIPSSIDQQTFTAMATRDGGEVVSIPRN